MVDNLLTGHNEDLLSDKFYNCDIKDNEVLDNIFKENEIETLIHFAANLLVGESVVKLYEYCHNNVYGMMCLFNVMKENYVDKMVFYFKVAIYRELKNIPIMELDETNPTNTYGKTKLAIEKIISDAWRWHSNNPNGYAAKEKCKLEA